MKKEFFQNVKNVFYLIPVKEVVTLACFTNMGVFSGRDI